MALLDRIQALGRRAASDAAQRVLAAVLPPSPPPVAPASAPVPRRVLPALTGLDVGPKVYVEESVRRQLTWTPTDIRNAESSADSGNLRRAAELCEEILADDRGGAVFRTRCNALLGSEVTFEASANGVGAPVAAPTATDALAKTASAALLAGDWWQLFPEDETGKLLVWGWLLGVGVGELVYPEDADVAPGARLVPRLRTWHPRFLRWNWQTRGWFLRTQDGEIRIEPGDGRWVLFTPYGSTRPWAHGLWRGLARLWLLKKLAQDDWGKCSEVHGNPIIVGTSQAGTDPALRRQLASDLSSLGRNAVIGCSPGVDIKLVEASAGTWTMFQAQIQMANTALSVAAIGTNLPTEVAAGVGTGATAQQSVRLDYLKADAQAASTFSHVQVLTVWAVVNFGTASVAPWAKFAVEPPEDLTKEAATIGALGDSIAKLDAALAPSGKRVDAIAVAEAAGIKLLALATPPSPAAPAATLPAAAPLAPAAASAPLDAIDPADMLTAAETEALVAEMNAHGIDRCRHGRNNVCPMCGIRRVNGLELDDAGQPVRDETGAPKWKVAWRPMAVTPPPEPAPAAAPQPEA